MTHLAEMGRIVTFTCCGVKYSKKDPESYWCIETDLIKDFTKKRVKEQKVRKEIIETLTCKKNGCLQVHIKRFGQFAGKFKILEFENLSGDEAALFLMKTENIRIRQPQYCPIKMTPFAKNIPLCFGKAISPTHQRRRYDGDKYWSDKFESNEGQWIPDIFESECKILKVG